MLRLVLAFSAVFSVCSFVAADVVYMKDGSVLEGTVSEDGDSVTVSVRNGAVTVKKSAVDRIEPKQVPWEEYAERAARLDDADVKGHLKLALWCKERKLRAEMSAELDKVIARDPDNETARKELGHVKYNGAWMTEAAAYEAQGLVNYMGEWIPRAQKELREALKRREELDRLLRGRIRQLIKETGDRDWKKAREAKAALAGLDGAFKLALLTEALSDSSPSVREYAACELGRLKSLTSLGPLARCYVSDGSSDVRIAAIESLQAIGGDAALEFVKYLSSDSCTVRIRAARALGALPDSRIIEALISALERNLKPTGGFSMDIYDASKIIVPAVPGGDPIVIARRVGGVISIRDSQEVNMENMLALERDTIIESLCRITGVNFGTDVRAWRQWLATRGK